MSNCTHQTVRFRYVSARYDPWDDSLKEGYKETYTESTYVDIDLHRYRCSLCGEVEYYSHAARLFYEDGIESPYIKGLHN